jgi:hypothetical protein
MTRLAAVFCVLIALPALSCRKAPPQDRTAPPSAASAAPAPAQPAPPGPEIDLAVNGSRQPDVVAGFPLLLIAEVLHPALGEASAAPITLASAQGSWTGWLHLEVHDSRGGIVNWPVQSVTSSPGALTLDRDTYGQAGWTLAPERTATLPEGTYRLSIVLDTTSAPDGWKGQATSPPAVVHIRNAPASLSAAQEEQKYLLLANYHGLSGSDQQAAADLDALLSRQPKSVGALALKGDLLTASGKFADALDAYDAALAMTPRAHGKGGEPPVDLLRRRRAALNAVVLGK